MSGGRQYPWVEEENSPAPVPLYWMWREPKQVERERAEILRAQRQIEERY